MNIHDQSLRTTFNTGEWWISPWWEDEEYFTIYPFTVREIAESFEALKNIFNKQWFINERDCIINEALIWLEQNADNIKRNPLTLNFYNVAKKASDYYEKFYAVAPFGFRTQHDVFDWLIHPGTIHFMLLVMLGRDIIVAEKANLIGDLYKRLRDADQFSGMYFELEILAILYRFDFIVKRPQVVNSKKCDFEVIKENEVIFLELKRLEPALLNKIRSGISHAILEEVTSDSAISRVRLTLELSEDISQKDIYEIRANWHAIACKIKKEILEKISNKQWGMHIIQGFARYMIKPINDAEIGGGGELSGMQLSLEEEIKKIISNAIEEAVTQLPKDQPGLLILDPPYTLMLDSLANALATEYIEWKEYKHLSGIMLFDSHFKTDKLSYDSYFIENQNARVNILNYNIVKKLINLSVIQ